MLVGFPVDALSQYSLVSKVLKVIAQILEQTQVGTGSLWRKSGPVQDDYPGHL